MNIGIVNEETFGFFNEIYQDLSSRHSTSLFRRRKIKIPFFRERLARYFLKRDLLQFQSRHEVVFFEWASQLLADVTNLPKKSIIVTRLHRYEMYQWIDQIDWENVDRIIVVSDAKRKEFLSRFPSQSEKIHVIPVGVDIDKFQQNHKEFSGEIGVLCHLTPRKGIYELILTFYELINTRPGFHLHIAGGAHPHYEDYSFAMHDVVARLGLQEHVTFHGHLEQPASFYKNIDIFISNSYSEGLQVAPMEAMASGCYCLSHRWAGAEELLPEENLYWTSNELQKKIITYASLPDRGKLEKQREMRNIAIEKFNIEKSKAQIREIIQDAVMNAGGQSFS